jgi:hypothetical protein
MVKMARLGVLIDRECASRNWSYGINAFEHFIIEILGHAGIPFQVIDQVKQVDITRYDTVIAALALDDEETSSVLWDYAEQGGVIIAYAGIDSVASKLGYVQAGPIGKGYAKVQPATDGMPFLRFLQANPWIPLEDGSTTQVIAVEEGRIMKGSYNDMDIGPALQTFHIGKGYISRWTVDILNTIIALQQGGSPVLDDGIPAPDGSGPVNEGILKADDRVELDWELDRLKTETGQPYFAYPYADLWREVIVCDLLINVTKHGLTLPFIGYWPDGISHVAMISHDSDGNQDVHAISTLKILKDYGIRSTWCMLEPGYSPEIYTLVKKEKHEVAFHYNALEKQAGIWGESEFNRQLEWLKGAVPIDEVVSNKNHYTCFRGWGELFRWMEQSRISSDQTRGPSKRGNVGFLFGTCHPYFPIAWWNEKNRLYNVLEIGFLTQDLDLNGWADSSIIVPFLEQVRRVEGVAHFLFHQKHIHNSEKVREAFRKVVQTCRQMGYVFLTGKQIHDWERARRHLRITGIDAHGNIQAEGDQPMDRVVIWVPLSKDTVAEDKDQLEERFGVTCKKQVVSIREREGKIMGMENYS